jgi:ABC-type glycerol-3-phosphate transport system substrate-binding protein
VHERMDRVTRRRFLRGAVGGVLAVGTLGLAACAPSAPPAPASGKPGPAEQGSSKPADVAKAPATAQKVTLQFWTNWAGAQKETWDKLMGEFHQAEPAVEIQSSFMSLAELQQKTVAALAGGQPPDLWINAAMVRPELVRDGAVVALDTLGKVPEDFFPASNRASLRDGKRWGVPNNGGLPVIWYHEALFQEAGLDPDKPPTTWEELVSYAEKVNKPEKKQFGIMFPNRPYPWTTEVWYGFLLQAGGDMLAPDEREVAFNSEAGVKALKLWSDVVNVQKVAPQTALDADTLVSTYQTGTVGLFPMYPVLTTRIKTFPFKSRNTPYPTNVKKGTHFAGNYSTIAAASKNKEAAFRWCEWWWQPEVNAKWCAGTGALPARASSREHAIYQEFSKSEPLTKAFLDSIEFAQAIPAVQGITEVQQALSEAIEAASFGRKEPKAALDEAAQTANAVLAKNR